MWIQRIEGVVTFTTCEQVNMKNISLIGHWTSETTRPKVFTNPNTNVELIVGQRSETDVKPRYYIFFYEGKTKVYISSLFTDYWRKTKAYNFTHEGQKYLWHKVGTGQVKITLLWRRILTFLLHIIKVRKRVKLTRIRTHQIHTEKPNTHT